MLGTEDALELGLVTFAPDDIDWDDEIRIAFEERAAFSPDAMTGMEASFRFAGPETMETKIFGRLSAWQNWIFQRPNAVGREGRAHAVRQAGAARVRLAQDLSFLETHEHRRTNEKIPNNVDLADDKRLQRALEQWQPNFIQWWKEMGPEGFQEDDVFLRTAISVDTDGWAHFDYVKMPDYRWGIFLADPGRRTAPSASATTWASPSGSRCRASTATRCGASSSPRATPSRRASSSSASSASRARASTTCATSSR